MTLAVVSKLCEPLLFIWKMYTFYTVLFFYQCILFNQYVEIVSLQLVIITKINANTLHSFFYKVLRIWCVWFIFLVLFLYLAGSLSLFGFSWLSAYQL